MHLLETLFTWAQLAVLVPLALLGVHRGWMVLLYRRHRGPESAPPPPTELPAVTVQLPIFNERHVAARLIEAVAALDYPHDRLEIQVLDDSTDDTWEIVEACLRRLPAAVRVEHLRRTNRTHFKAGALAAGLERAGGDLVAVFDADFVPPPEFLRRSVPLFTDPQVGMVQCRWDHLNADYSLLTRMQALLLDGHFAIEHLARSRSGCFFNFNGTAGVFRRTCIEEAGGWHGDTLTEDMDLSYRAQLAGWRFLYRPELACPAELPVDMNAFLSQQHRWAKGSIPNGAQASPQDLAPARSRARSRRRAGFHLLGNLAFPLLLALIVIALPLQALRLWNGTAVSPALAMAEGLPLLLSTLCVLGYYGFSQLDLHRLGPAGVLRIPLVLAVGAGLSVNNTLAVASALRSETGEFLRTPKNAILRRGESREKRAYRSHRGLLPGLEIGLGSWALGTCGVALWLGLPLTAIFHGLFGAGLLWVGLSSLADDRPAGCGRSRNLACGGPQAHSDSAAHHLAFALSSAGRYPGLELRSSTLIVLPSYNERARNRRGSERDPRYRHRRRSVGRRRRQQRRHR